MRQLVAEVLGVVASLEIAPVRAPIGDGVDHAMDQLTDAALAVGRAHLAVEILADHNVGGRLGPFGRHLHFVLLEDDGAFVVGNRGGAQLPGDLVVRGLALFELLSEVLRETYALAFGALESLFAGWLQVGNPIA